MSKKARILLAVGIVVVLVVGCVSLSVYFAFQRVPDFYRKAIARSPEVQKEASHQLVQQATALASDLHRRGRWQALFTEDQINGWLAVDRVRHFPDLLPSEVHDPRIAIDEQEATIAFRYKSGALSTVFSFKFDLYLTSPNVVALRVRHARAGSLPMPLADVLRTIGQAANEISVPIEWRQVDGDPVALITIPPPRDQGDRELRLEAIELHSGKLYLSGTNLEEGELAEQPVDAPKGKSAAAARTPRLQVETIGSTSKKNRQR